MCATQTLFVLLPFLKVFPHFHASIELVQKQPPELFYGRFFEKFRKIHRKSPVPESHFDNVVG